MTFEIFKGTLKVGEVEATGATPALIRGRDIFGDGVSSAVAKIEDDGIDIRVLHSTADSRPPTAALTPRPAMASIERESPKTADFESGRARGIAANGEGQRNGRAMGTTPQSGKVFYPIKNKTHFKRKGPRKMRDRKNSCADKIRYPNSAAAHADIHALVCRRKTGKKKFRSLRAYRCDCGGWHITHQ